MNALEVIVGDMLATAARLALSLDQDHHRHLAQLEGQSLQIHCTNPPQRVSLRVAAGQLDVLPGSDNPTDVTVTGPLTDLIALMRGGSPGKALRVNGNPSVLRDFARLFEDYNPDFSALIPEELRSNIPRSPFTGSAGPSGPELFEAFRGIAEVGIASIGKALQSAMETSQGPNSNRAAAAFTQSHEAEARDSRLQQLGNRLRALSDRIDTLDRDSSKPT